MWVKSIKNTMTEHSGQSDPAETLRRILIEHSLQIQSQGSTLHTLLEQQRHSSQQLDQMASILLHALNLQTPQSPEQAAKSSASPPVSQQLLCSRDVTPPNLENYSGEISNCGGFLLQCSLVFNCSHQSFPHDNAKIAFIIGLLCHEVGLFGFWFLGFCWSYSQFKF
ncbi:hypothetical protein AMECASPLE_001203 [Ameca splendens]|uniref:Uncharacterized protein n=1 Tax=Ameca splendens TaxID=208324 RepID=A0ABV0XLZ5_9TELE